MRLSVVTPLATVVEAGDVAHLRAEDETGAFGILAGHADFLTVLAVSVVSWRNSHGAEHHIAVRRGILELHGGDTITIAAPEAIPGDDLYQLEADVLTGFRARLVEEQAARTDDQRLYVAAIRQIARFIRSEGTVTATGHAAGPAERYER